MPLVDIYLTSGRTQEQKNEIARRVALVISEVTDVAIESVWTKFQDVSADEWYVGTDSIAQRRRQRETAG